MVDTEDDGHIRSPTGMLQPLIMIKPLQRREDFMRQFGIKCIEMCYEYENNSSNHFP